MSKLTMPSSASSRLKPVTRREFLERSGALFGAGAFGFGPSWLSSSSTLSAEDAVFRASESPPAERPKVAVIFTAFYFRSHTYNILESFLVPYLFRGKLVDPGVEVVSLYADQFPDNDMARDVSRRFKIPLYDSIAGALRLEKNELAVDAVLSIGEHGNYPINERGQKMYPRKRFFDESVAVMKASGRFVPFFNDKHLSYRWDEARQMYDTSRKHGFPLMAGSSVPLAERRPPIEIDPGTEIEEAVSIHAGGLESYDFHGLENLQSMVEFRKGGETGIAKVELIKGEALERALETGRISKRLIDAAMQAERRMSARRQPRPDQPDFRAVDSVEGAKPRHAILLTYNDGLRATVMTIGSSSNRWNFACKVKGRKEPLATAWFNGPWGNRCLFKALSHAIQHLFIHRKEPYPAERTLLTTGALDVAMRSHEQQGRPIDTPELAIRYEPVDFRALRENGATWKIITTDTPQPTTFDPGDAKFLPQ